MVEGFAGLFLRNSFAGVIVLAGGGGWYGRGIMEKGNRKARDMEKVFIERADGVPSSRLAALVCCAETRLRLSPTPWQAGRRDRW